MHKPWGITSAFAALLSTLVVAIAIIWGMWLPSATQLDNDRNAATRQTVHHVIGLAGPPTMSVEDSNGRTYYHLVIIDHPDFLGNPQHTPMIVKVDSTYPPSTIGLNVTQSGHVDQANGLPESHQHWWPLYIGWAVLGSGLILLLVLGAFMVRAWRDYRESVAEVRRERERRAEQERKELARRADLSQDQGFLELALARIQALDDTDPDKKDLLKQVTKLMKSAANPNPNTSEAAQLKIQLELFAQSMKQQD